MRIVKFCFIVSILLLTFFSKGQQLLSAEELASRLKAGKDTTYVLNFWATWCDPCIKEIPAFEKLNLLANKKVKVLLVSIDKANKLKYVKSFVKNHGLNSPVLLLLNPQVFIRQFYSKWKGDLPLTFIYKPGFEKPVQIITTPVIYDDLLTGLN